MHYGSLPDYYVPGRSSLLATVQALPPGLSTTPNEPGVSRREWLTGVVGFAAGGAAVFSGNALAGPSPALSPESKAPPEPLETPDRMTPEWALSLLLRSEEDLLANAGEMERVSMQHRTDPRLVPCFQRVLDVALAVVDVRADQAAACAVRSLGRLGRDDLLTAAVSRLGERTDLTEASAAATAWLEKLRR